MKKALFYTLMFITVQLMVTYITQGVIVAAFSDKISPDSGPVMVGVTIASSLLTIALFYGLKWSSTAPRYYRSRPWAQLFWTILAALGTLLPAAWLQEHLPPLPDLLETHMKSIISTPGGYLALGILAPLAEEAVFRGAVLRELLSTFKEQAMSRSNRHWVAIAISALLFALVHMNPAQMPHAFLIGLLLGWLYYRTGSILPGVIFHIVNNTVAVVLEKLYPTNDEMSLLDLFGGNERTVTLSIIFSLFILLPSLYQLSWRMNKG